jgi:hypothetical protein
MNQHSTRQAFYRYRTALQEAKNGMSVRNRLRRSEANRQAMIDADTPGEVRHQLTDHRDNNKVIATRTMDRRTAYEMNQRLKNSGYAWAARTGY